MREACVNDIAAEFTSIMELNANEAHGLMDRLLSRQPRRMPDSGRKHRRDPRRHAARKSARTDNA